LINRNNLLKKSITIFSTQEEILKKKEIKKKSQKEKDYTIENSNLNYNYNNNSKFILNDKIETNLSKIFENKKSSLILSDDQIKYRKILTQVTINRLKENFSDEQNEENYLSKEDFGLFLSPYQIYKKRSMTINKNGFGVPRGALIITDVPEISMIYYKFFRMFCNNNLRVSRLGGSMMSMSAISEQDDDINNVI
jgi:hypothetical protein